MKTIHFLSLLVSVCFLLNCSPRLSPFTLDLKEENSWSANDLQKIQFYLSRDIKLQRDYTTGASKIEDGKIRMVNGRKVEEIIISRGTPGVLIHNPANDKLAISFEEGDNESYLMFGPNPKVGDKYVLLAKKWQQNGGTVTYGGRTFYTDRSSAYSALMVDLKKIKRTRVKSRVAKGRKL